LSKCFRTLALRACNKAEDLLRARSAVLSLVVATLLSTSAESQRAGANPCTPQPATCLHAIEQVIIELFEKTAPSVVQITALSGLNDKTRFAIIQGSGFVWDTDGNIVTNEHLLRGAEVISISFASGKPLDAEIVGLAANYDLAVLRLKRAQELPPPIPHGSSDALKVGQFVYAIGNPYGLDQSLTTGFLTALKRQLPTGRGREIANMIQTNAALFPGNSGGPLLDSSGRLIGVNTVAYLTGQLAASLGFAIPVDVVSRIAPELIRSGRIPTAGIGIVPGLGAEGDRHVAGVIVGQVLPGSPAEQAGLRGASVAKGISGDVIVSANGQPIRSIYDLTAQLEHVGIGTRISLGVERDGSFLEIEVEIIDIDATPATSGAHAKR
jgi:S1-C subfamily serine protease